MKPIVYKKDYRKSTKSYANTPDELECVLSPLRGTSSAVEVISEPDMYRTYLDLDVFLPPDIPEADFAHLDNLALFYGEEVIKGLVGDRIQSICTSSLRNYIEGKSGLSKSKISYHFVCSCVDTIQGNKKFAQSCNTLMERKIRQVKEYDLRFLSECFDLNVYGRTQCWRLVGSIKANDPPEKVKRLLKGSFGDSILTVYSGSLHSGVLSSLIESRFEPIPVVRSGRFDFLWECLEDPRSKGILTEKVARYSSWVELASCIVYIVQQDGSLEEEALELFLTLSSLVGPSLFKEADCVAKFNSLKGVVRQSHENAIKEWIKPDMNIDLSLFDLLDCDALDFNDCDPIIPQFTPRTETQYVVLQYLSTPALVNFWKQQIQTSSQMSKVRLLLADDKDGEYVKLLQRLSSFCSIDIPQGDLPFDIKDHDEDFLVMKHYSLVCTVVISDQEIRKLLDVVPKETEISSYNTEVRGTIARLCPELIDQLKKTCPHHWGDGTSNFKPLLRMQNREEGPYNYIRSLIDEPLLYRLRVPYKTQLEFIRQKCRGSDELFRYMLLKYSDKFAADKHFRFICSVYDDRTASRVVVDLYPFWTVNSVDELFVYDIYTGLWSHSSSCHFKIMTMLTSFLYDPPNGKGESKSFGGNISSAMKVISCIVAIPGIRRRYNFEDLQSSSTGKLLFPNGYWDGHKDIFYPCMAFDDGNLLFAHPEIFFFASCPDNYIMKWSEDALEEVEHMKDVLFYKMHKKHIAEFHIESLACALLGVKHKGFYVHIGDTNSGKSTEKSMIENTFGEYIGTGHTDDFALIKDDKREASLVSSFAYNNYYKRLILFSEKSDRKLSTELLKTHSSGQEDKVRTRVQYKTSITVSVQYTMFFYMNSAFEVTNPNDSAYIERAFFYYWNKVFLPEERITDPTTQIPAIPGVQQWKDIPMRRQMYAKIIFDGFRNFIRRGAVRLPIPEEIRQTTNDEVGTIETAKSLFEKIMYGFVLDGNPESLSERSEILRKCEELEIDSKKMGQRIGLTTLQLGLGSIYSKVVRINGKTQNCWVGMSVRNGVVKEGDYLTDLKQWEELMKRHKGVIPMEVANDLKRVALVYKESPLTHSERDVELIEELGTEYQKRVYRHRAHKRTIHQL